MAKTKKAQVEWVGGVAQMPSSVVGEGAPYRPEALLWLDPTDGVVLGMTVAKPGEILAGAVESLTQTIARPMVAKARAPQRIRVASQDLAQALRVGHPTLEVVCAPTPEVDVVMDSMREHLAAEHQVQTYLGPGVSPALMASFFHSAAALYRAKPWGVVPADQNFLAVTIEEFGLRDAVLVIIGHLGDSFGFILFSTFDDFDAFHEAASALERGEEAFRMPRHSALNFERGADLDPSMRKEVSKHGWEVAGPAAYPVPIVVEEDVVARPATVDEVNALEAIALALPQLLRSHQQDLTAAWNDEAAVVSSQVKVKTHGGEVEVAFRVPHPKLPSGSPLNLMDEFFELAQEDEIDPAVREELEAELLARFEDSPEGRALAEVSFASMLMDFAANYFTATIATLTPPVLKELVFHLLPQKASVAASEAGNIIAELRAFYSFLNREFGLPQAEACLQVLGAGAVKKLTAAMSDSSNFGMAKSLFMAGAEAGFDMTTEKGLNEWMQQVSSKPLPDSFPLLGFLRPAPRPDPREKKKQRKQAKKARRKNR